MVHIHHISWNFQKNKNQNQYQNKHQPYETFRIDADYRKYDILVVVPAQEVYM